MTATDVWTSSKGWFSMYVVRDVTMPGIGDLLFSVHSDVNRMADCYFDSACFRAVRMVALSASVSSNSSVRMLSQPALLFTAR